MLNLITFLAAMCLVQASDAPLKTISPGVLNWGSDQEGGGPFIMPDERDPSKLIGFEVEIVELIARELKLTTKFRQSGWAQLLQLLDRDDIDLVINGYEYSDERAAKYRASIPYFTYALGLVVDVERKALSSWSQLKGPKPGGGKWLVGVLQSSAADDYATEHLGEHCEIKRYDGVIDVMSLVSDGRLDATVQDTPIIAYYLSNLKRFPKLKQTDQAVADGYYVVYTKKNNQGLSQAIDDAIKSIEKSGELKRVLDRYSLYNERQAQLPTLWQTWDKKNVAARQQDPILERINRYIPIFARAAWVTVSLTLLAMPIAALLGVIIAVLRCQGSPRVPIPTLIPSHVIPSWLIRIPLTIYVEVIRGTPILFQLFVIYFVLPHIGLHFSDFWAGVLALAINYSAYEAEIVRLGLEAIPRGQLEAGLSLGMSNWQATRRIILAQAWRLILPASANDFIAMFKDTAVCGTIAVVELSKQFYVTANSTGDFLFAAGIASVFYLCMSYPLSLLVTRLEHYLKPT